jgi:hypothetical protein
VAVSYLRNTAITGKSYTTSLDAAEFIRVAQAAGKLVTPPAGVLARPPGALCCERTDRTVGDGEFGNPRRRRESRIRDGNRTSVTASA